MKKLFVSIVLTALSFSASAQTYEQNQIDSLRRIVNNPEIKDADRIEPLAQLSRYYLQWRDDSIRSADFFERANSLALKQNDSKYMIYVYNQELAKSLNAHHKDIATMYSIIDNIYDAISRTTDREAQAAGYAYIGHTKSQTDKGYDCKDVYKALSLVETITEKSERIQKLLCTIYTTLFRVNEHKDSKNAEKYMNLLLQAAEKSNDKNNICKAIAYKLSFSLENNSNDKNSIIKIFDEAEHFVSQNRKYISLYAYGSVITFLVQTEINTGDMDEQRKKLIDKHVENFEKMMGNSIEGHEMFIRIGIMYSFTKQDYEKTLEYIQQEIKFDEYRFADGLWLGYRNMAEVYTEMKQYKQASEAYAKSLEAYQQTVSNQSGEQRQLNDVKFGVLKQEQQIRQQYRRTGYIIISAIAVIILLLGVISLLNRQKKIVMLKKANAELMAEKAELMAKQALAEKDKMGERLITNEAELTRKNQLLDKAKDMDNKQLSKAIHREQRTSKVTKDYAKLFHEIRPEFYERLAQQAAPNKLTGTELKYCAYILLRMNGKDLSNVMNVGYNTVATHKQNLKKKLHLTGKDSLDAFIVKITHPINTDR